MFRGHNVKQIQIGQQNPDLREKLNHFNIDKLTDYEVRTQARQSSFFNKLVIPNKQAFLERKTAGQKFSFTDWQETSTELEKKYSKIESFVTSKVRTYIDKNVEKATQDAKNMLSKRDQTVLKLFEDRYGERIGYGWSDVSYIITLNGYLDFLADKDRYSSEIILDRLSGAYQNIEDGRDKTTSKFSLLRLISPLVDEANENLIETVYNLQYAPKLLKMVLKRNKDLQSFKNDPKRLIKLVRYDDRHYSQYSYGSDYTTGLKLKKEQVIEFAKFYLTTEDKRLNSKNVINELCLHLRKYGETDLINELVLNHHRLYSSVIAGSITKDSYSSHTKGFLRYILGEKYDAFWDLVTADDESNFSNAIKIGV